MVEPALGNTVTRSLISGITMDVYRGVGSMLGFPRGGWCCRHDTTNGSAFVVAPSCKLRWLLCPTPRRFAAVVLVAVALLLLLLECSCR